MVGRNWRGGVTICLSMGVAAFCLPVAAAAATTTFGAAADARVEAANPSTNFGTSTLLRVDGGSDPDVDSYFRFSVAGVSGTVQQATLRLYATTDTTNGPSLYATASNWSESQITWANRPLASTAAIARRAVVTPNTWVDYDVTSLVRGDGTYSMSLHTLSVDGLNYASREASANRPQLVVTTAPSTTPGDPTVAAAGDIACKPGDTCLVNAAATATAVVALHPTAVLALGDIQYENATTADFAAYDSTWGIFKSITHPAVGNHEYLTPGAAGYYGYFGAAAGNPSQGWYSFDLGAWHLIELNTECSFAGGCTASSPQGRWLQADLASHPRACTLAFFHQPRFEEDSNHNNTAVGPLWDLLYSAGADVILNGHAHDYERFAPRAPSGTLDPTRGIREFVVGTGGRSLNSPDYRGPKSEVNQHSTYGVLQLTLHATSYGWRFVPVAGGSSFTDSGTAACH
jgi:acid phosphatase type 7